MSKQQIIINYDLVGDVHTVILAAQEPVLLSWQGTFFDTAQGACKVRLRGSGTLSIDNPNKGVLNVDIKTKQQFTGEELDDLPPPEMAPPANWLQAMRQKIRNEMGTTREAFAERQSIYEMGDVDLFEEELTEAQIAQQEELRQAAAETTEEIPDTTEPVPSDASTE